MQQYLKKGSKVYIEGMIKTRKWTDKNEIERYTTEIIANQMQMLDSKRDAEVEHRPESEPKPFGEILAEAMNDEDVPS